jgi:two-component system sensor histidine kinase BarA
MKIKVIASGLALLAIIGLAVITKKNVEAIKASIAERSTQDNLLLVKAIGKHGNQLLEATMTPSLVLAQEISANKNLPLENYRSRSLPPPMAFLDLVNFDANGRCLWAYLEGCTAINSRKRGQTADFEYFQSHPAATLFVSRTYQSQRLKKMVFTISRPKWTKTNDFNGVIRTFVDPKIFIDSYQDLLKNNLARISLVGNDGFTRARLTGDGRITVDDDVTQSLPNTATQSNDNGTIISTDLDDGSTRMVAWQAMTDYPLYITSSTSIKLELSPYAKAKRAGIGSVIAMILAVIGIYLAFMHWLHVSNMALALSKQKLGNAEDLNRVKTTIVSTVAHELRTPLFAILGFTELIGLMTKDELTRDYANTASVGAHRLSMIIDNMLDLSKIDAGRFDKKLELIEIKHFIETTAALYAQAVRNQKIELLIDVPQPITIECNETALSRVLFNLLNNAIKFTKTGSVSLRAKQHDTNTVVIEVEDSGIGIPQEDIPKLFERFSDVDKQRHPEGKGSGLGLSLVKELVTVMGGEISVSSRVNHGTRVSIQLPLNPPLLHARSPAPLTAQSYTGVGSVLSNIRRRLPNLRNLRNK